MKKSRVRTDMSRKNNKYTKEKDVYDIIAGTLLYGLILLAFTGGAVVLWWGEDQTSRYYRLLNLARVIVRCHPTDGEGQVELLRLAGTEQFGLSERHQRSEGLSEFPLRDLRVNLRDRLPGDLRNIRDLDREQNLAAPFLRKRRKGRHHDKLRVGQAVPERIIDPFLFPGNGLEISIADVDILRVIHVVRCLMKTGGRRIILQLFGKCIRQFSGRIHLTRQDTGDRCSGNG